MLEEQKERLFSFEQKSAFEILKDQKREVKCVFASNNRFQYFQKPLFPPFSPIFPSSINNNKKERGREKKTFFIGINVHARKQVAWKYNITLIDIKILQRTTLSRLANVISLPLGAPLSSRFLPTYYSTDPLLRKKARITLSSRDFTRLRQKFPSLHPTLSRMTRNFVPTLIF